MKKDLLVGDGAERWRYDPPRQERGRRTEDRIIDAVERLIEDRPFEDVSIDDIVRTAETTTGSFYARFGSKDAVLPRIYERYHAEVSAEIEEAARRTDWSSLGFREAIRQIVSLAAHLPRTRPWRMRTISLFARTRPEALPADVRQRSVRGFQVADRALAPHRDRVRRPDRERAIAFISFVVVTAARERLVFPDAPLASALPHEPEEFLAELETLVAAYLTAPDSSESAEKQES